MNKLFILFLSIFTVNAATGVKISDYPRASSVGTNDLFIISSYSGAAYTTNKSVSYGALLNQISTAVTNNFGRYNVVNYGAISGADSTVAVQAAYDAISSTDGGELFFPIGEWKFNLVINKPNVTVSGVSHEVDFLGTMHSRLIPANTANPVIQVGNNTAYVKGVVIKDVTLDGQSTGAIGLYLAGGAFECTIKNVAVSFFTNCIKVMGGTTYPASLIRFQFVDGQPANVANARGIYLVQTANYPNSYTTEINFTDCHWNGPSSGSNSRMLETDSVEFKLVNCYFDVSDGRGFKISNNFAPFPWIDAINSNVDSGLSTRVAIEGYANTRIFAGIAGINFQVNGKYKELDGTLMVVPPSHLRQNSLLVYPSVFGALTLTDSTATNWLGGSYTNYQFYAGTDVLYAQSSGIIRNFLGLGQFTLENKYVTDKSMYLIFKDYDNNTAQILSLQGNIYFRATNGAAIRFQNIAGNNWGQINATDGGTFWFGAGLGAGSSTTAGSLLFLDSNGQMRTNVAASIASTNLTVKGTIFVDNVVATNGITLGTGGTNLSVTGNVLANGLIVTNTFTAKGAIVTPSVTISASDIDISTGSLFTKNLSGNTVFTFSNPVESQQFSVIVTNGSTFTVTWPTVEWKGGTTPVQSVNQTDVYSFIYANGKYLGVQSPGSAPGVEQEAYSAGTVYSLTATPALLDFGTTDPTVTVTDAGTYLIYWGGNYKYNAATFVANQTANMKVRRTNNTAADISNATLTTTTRVITTITDDLAVMAGKPVKYVAASGDILQVWGSLSATPSAGSVDCTDAWIVLLRIQ